MVKVLVETKSYSPRVTRMSVTIEMNDRSKERNGYGLQKLQARKALMDGKTLR